MRRCSAFVSPSPMLSRSSSRHSSISACAAAQEEVDDDPPIEIAVCTGPTCTKDGSGNTSAILSAILAPHARRKPTCTTTGCLGECGQGPNAVLTIGKLRPKVVTGVRTVHAASNLLTRMDIPTDDDAVSAVETKHVADTLFRRGAYADAVVAYAEAADALSAVHDLYIAVLCNWSCALVECARGEEALVIANRAVEVDAGWPGAWRRKAEAHERLRHTALAVTSWQTWGRLAGRDAEARQNARRVKRRAWFRF